MMYIIHCKNKAYLEGVQYAVSTITRQNKEPVVLDIGTGTGLLAMLVAKCGAKKITACEVSGLLSSMQIYYSYLRC